jgi:hypothetical protein
VIDIAARILILSLPKLSPATLAVRVAVSLLAPGAFAMYVPARLRSEQIRRPDGGPGCGRYVATPAVAASSTPSVALTRRGSVRRPGSHSDGAAARVSSHEPRDHAAEREELLGPAGRGHAGVDTEHPRVLGALERNHRPR